MHDAIPSRILNGWLRLEEDLFHLQVLSFLPPQIPICCSIFIFKLYHKTCEQFYRHFGLYEKSPNSFLSGLPRSIINQFDFHNFLCLCLASVHLPYPFHLVSAFSFSVTPFRFANSGTISSMRFRAASSILAQYCLTYTQPSARPPFSCIEVLHRFYKMLTVDLTMVCYPADGQKCVK